MPVTKIFGQILSIYNTTPCIPYASAVSGELSTEEYCA